MFLGPYEHHSNELPWRESGADVVTIREDADGRIDVAHLEAELRRHEHRALKVGSFSAASNVTGIVSDVDRISNVLHRHGALACWDYAVGRPVPPDRRRDGKDAVFLSPHKFAGGPSTPGVLVAKRSLLRDRVPSVPGGGTIVFVSPTAQSYHPDPAIREEAGTPAIVESIRAGLVFALKEAVGAEEIRRREGAFARRALASWGRNPQLRILGGAEPERLAIVSFGVRHPRGLLHADFVVAVLSDLFGIQARSGCFCAGPYIHRIHPIDDAWSAAMHEQARQGYAGATLAFSRVSFGYYISEAVFDYIVEAVHLLASTPGSCCRSTASIPARGSGGTRTPVPGRCRACATCVRLPAPRVRRRRPRARSRTSSTRRDGSSARWRRATPRAARPAAAAGVRTDPLVPAAGRAGR